MLYIQLDLYSIELSIVHDDGIVIIFELVLMKKNDWNNAVLYIKLDLYSIELSIVKDDVIVISFEPILTAPYW